VTFTYDGDKKNFNFDKYVTLHVEQHNLHADLPEYGVSAFDESMKILWFQNGIKCPALDTVKASINANKANFTRFDTVKDAYVEFKRTMTPTSDPRTRQVPLSAQDAVAAAVLAKPGVGEDRRPETLGRRA